MQSKAAWFHWFLILILTKWSPLLMIWKGHKTECWLNLYISIEKLNITLAWNTSYKKDQDVSKTSFIFQVQKNEALIGFYSSPNVKLTTTSSKGMSKLHLLQKPVVNKRWGGKYEFSRFALKLRQRVWCKR
jgi:hypothetical protein